MSGYRTLHRENVESTAIWNVATSPLLISSSSNQKQQRRSGHYRVWTASADGCVRSYHVQEKSMHDKQDDAALDASALSMTCSHVFVGTDGHAPTTTAAAAAALGCTQVCLARNYVGDDDAAGDLIVASLDMAGTVRLGKLSEDEDGSSSSSDSSSTASSGEPKQIRAAHEFQVENATGTVLMVCPPRWTGPGKDVSVAVACLDGTVAQVATGWLTPQKLAETSNDGSSSKAKEATPAGTVLDRWGSRGSSIALSMTSHPVATGVVAIGRQDGQLDTILVTNSNSQNNPTDPYEQKQRRHRLRFPGQDHDHVPIRAVTYTPDGNLLAAGNDAGALAVWDVSRASSPAVLVHHIVQAHASWILDICALTDSRRWVTCGADRKLHVWKVDQMYQPVHTFDSDQTVWTLGLTTTAPSSTSPATTTGPLDKAKTAVRLAAGSETGGLQILSLDA